MSTQVALIHRIEQRFDRRLSLPTHWLRLRPAPHTRPAIAAYSIKVHTEPHFLNWVRDPFENHLARLDLPEPVSDLSLEVELIADLEPVNPFDFLTEPFATDFPFEYPEQLRKELAPYLSLGRVGPRLADWLGTLDRSGDYIVEKLGRINEVVHRLGTEAAPAAGGRSPGAVDPEAVLARGAVSPWEAAWLLTLGFRHLGLAARFTSGYRIFLASEPGGLDSADLHAWSEAFVPGAGWIGLDPAAGLYIHEGYIPLASTPDPLRALPVTGQAEGNEADRSERVAVRRLVPAPAPSPYTETQWADIRAVGRHVDAVLADESLGLANGATLCFGSAADAHAPEWSFQALGPGKRAAAEDLLARLKGRLAPGGVIQESQGEWFGGESLPRWRLNCFFRADGQPVWRNPSLLGHTVKGPGLGAADAEYFGKMLAKKLGLASACLIPAHEDPLHELWLNRREVHFQPPAEALRDPLRRHELAASLSETRCEPVGHVLPLRRDPVAERWTSGVWRFRRGALYLVPGDSPLGYRLPLASLPAGDDARELQDPERCPFEERPLLAGVYGELSARLTTVMETPALEAADSDHPRGPVPRTALCIRIGNGRLHVFLPPLTHLEHYLELLTAVEATALSLGVAVSLEGYEPPEDHRLLRLTLEPEAAVLRVSLPMAENWDRTLDYVAAAYREATNAGLTALPLRTEGRRAGPGGGADLVLGGAKPADSPFLRRPRLLRSLITYWQRHPSLSYFFAGRLIGPSGSAPRPDEGREDALYELDIALARLPRNDDPLPWMPDRILRHLLADPAGDIRRAEIRIDQLYAPDRAGQRLGRIALRAFETAGGERLAAAQVLLARGLVARLAKYPANLPLIDWGTALHDRFMLPRLLWEDLGKVLADIEEAGIPLRADWFRPFLDQRFPVLGRMQFGPVGIELRPAHEPWPVLAEEVTAGGVARFVDSANDRVQVQVTGLTPGRHVLVCNDRRVPLQATGIKGECVAGIRYKSGDPAATLHPTVPPVHSLVFDLVDAWTGQVLGGFTYFPSRPAAREPVGTPPPSGESQGVGAPLVQRPQPAVLPPASLDGQFLDGGSKARYRVPPPETVHPRYPYLLDLTYAEGP
jgi:uncharacterized protein (DUF2126 family)/transglutaminase-like putative cysteine protease